MKNKLSLAPFFLTLKSIDALGKKDYEDAFVQLFPAIDKTAKKRRSKDGVGARIKKKEEGPGSD
ncbi:hypothetical protein CCP3SC5AM1_2270004 [Gammaproteobacteria bacterium]